MMGWNYVIVIYIKPISHHSTIGVSVFCSCTWLVQIIVMHFSYHQRARLCVTQTSIHTYNNNKIVVTKIRTGLSALHCSEFFKC